MPELTLEELAAQRAEEQTTRAIAPALELLKHRLQMLLDTIAVCEEYQRKIAGGAQ